MRRRVGQPVGEHSAWIFEPKTTRHSEIQGNPGNRGKSGKKPVDTLLDPTTATKSPCDKYCCE